MAEAMPFQSYPEPNFVRVSLRVPLTDEIANRRVRGGQRLFVGQENDAEVFRPGTLAEAGAVHDRYMLLTNEFGYKNVVAFRDVDARVRVESPARRYTTHARSFVAPLHGQIAAAAQLALHFDEVILRTFERGLDRVLLGMVSAQARTQQLVHTFQVRLDDGSFAAGNAPSNAPSRSEVILRQSAERNDRQIGRDRGHGNMGIVVLVLAVDNQLVVNFIRKDNQIMLAGEFGDLFQHRARTYRAGRVVGIDQHNPARPRRDLFLDVVEIGLPAVFFVQVIIIQSDSELRQNRGIERIIGAGRKQVIARIEQRGQAEVDRLADARSDEDILNVSDPFAGRLAANRFERLRDSRRTRISIITVAHCAIDGFNHVGGRLEVKVERVADVERQNLVSLPGDLIGNAGQVADGVADVFETGGWALLTFVTGRDGLSVAQQRWFRAGHAHAGTLLVLSL